MLLYSGKSGRKIIFLTHVENNFFNPCIFQFLLNLVTPLVDSATVWRQTMFFTRVLALLGTKPCYLRWFWRSTELISDALEQNMGILSRRFALLFFVFSPLSSLFCFFFSFYDPSRLFFVFLFFVLLQKCSPLGLAEKMNFYIFKRILFTIVFFGRSGARFYVIFQGLSNSQNG